MHRNIPMSDTPAGDATRVELCLRIGQTVFGMSFTDLQTAREAARHINLSGRDVQIYEKYSGKVIEASAAVPGSKPQAVHATQLDAKNEGATARSSQG